MKTFNSVEDFEKAVGTHLGYSDWYTITQAQIDQFAEVTGDHQWIHVDPARAAKSPYGTTIAHGYLTLSLIPQLASQVYTVEGLTMVINYGSEKVRFPSPVPVGSRIRAGAELLDVTRGAKGALATFRMTVERDGSDKPACVAETVLMVVD